MFKYYFNKRPVIEESQTNNVSVFVRHNYLQFKKQLKENGRDLDLNKENDVKLFIEIVKQGVTVNLRQENNGQVTNTDYMNKINLTYTKSNLKKGFVFWFICNLCDRKVRYLYFPPNSEVMACRRCHRLAYRKQIEARLRAPKWLFNQ